MKSIILKKIDDDGVVHYASLGDKFSFDYEIVVGLVLIGFYDANGSEAIFTTVQLGNFSDTRLAYFDEEFEDKAETYLFQLIQDEFEEYIVGEEDIFDLNAFADKADEALSKMEDEMVKEYYQKVKPKK